MASRLMKRHLQLAVVMYLVMFVVIMYFWQKKGSHQVKDSRHLSVLQSAGLHRDQQPPSGILPQRGPGERSAGVNLPTQLPPLTVNAQQLVIAADFVNSSSVNASYAVGVMEGEGGADHTLTSRMTSVFRSVLDCPQKLPLTFLGMNWTSVDLSQDPACKWIKSSWRNAEQNFVSLGEEMAVLKAVTLSPQKLAGTKGGDKIERVFHQKEDSEYFKVRSGFFSLPCKNRPQGIKFHVDKRNYRRFNHLNQWFDTLICATGSSETQAENEQRKAEHSKFSRSNLEEVSRGYVRGVTLALERYEYANVYHTMLDWYNVFISVLILGIDPNYATFLIVDGHPWGKLDSTWANMFGGRGVLRAGHLPKVTTFEYMVWVPNGYHSPIFDTDRSQVPFLPQLREYFFRSYGVTPNPGPECRHLRMVLVRRRDYLAHPRNPKGVLARKMDNEDEVRDALAAAFPQHQVTAVQLDLLPMRQQLEILSRVDILVGMHGAALTYTALLPEGAALVEMYPKYAGKTSMLFKQIAQWRGIHYIYWMNQDSKNEKPNMYTYIPTPVVVDMVKQMIAKMCPSR